MKFYDRFIANIPRILSSSSKKKYKRSVCDRDSCKIEFSFSGSRGKNSSSGNRWRREGEKSNACESRVVWRIIFESSKHGRTRKSTQRLSRDSNVTLMADWSRTTDVPRRRFTMPRLNRDPQIITLPIYPGGSVDCSPEQWEPSLLVACFFSRQNDRSQDEILRDEWSRIFEGFLWNGNRRTTCVNKGTRCYFRVLWIKFQLGLCSRTLFRRRRKLIPFEGKLREYVKFRLYESDHIGVWNKLDRRFARWTIIGNIDNSIMRR